LMIISLTDNKLESIPENLFKTNKNLENVWLDYNNLKEISSTTFGFSQKLDYVDLENNECVNSFYWLSSAREKLIKDLTTKCLPTNEKIMKMEEVIAMKNDQLATCEASSVKEIFLKDAKIVELKERPETPCCGLVDVIGLNSLWRLIKPIFHAETDDD
jgi:Leucine-rich repeat (LRR) protein